MMIGNYVAPVIYLREPSTPEPPILNSLRHELRRGCLTLAVLSALRLEQHGYGLRKTLAARGISIEQGTLYPLLRRLERQGLLRSELRDEGRRRKRFYRPTPAGSEVQERLLAEWQGMDAALNRLLLGPQHRAA